MDEINQKPKIEIYDPVADVAMKFDFYIKIVIGVLIVGFISMLLMVGGILLDAWHFNSATYKEYSEKAESVEITQQINRELLNQNKKNQEIIIQLQKQLLNK